MNLLKPIDESIRSYCSMLSLLTFLWTLGTVQAQQHIIERLEYHPCVTNLLDINSDCEMDTNDVCVGLWYSATNIIKWQARANVLYIPEWSVFPTGPWISNCYLSTNAPGLMEYRVFNYVIDDAVVKSRFFRVRSQ